MCWQGCVPTHRGGYVSHKVAILVKVWSSGLVGRSRLTMKGEGEIITTYQKSATTSGTMEFREKEGELKGYTTRSVFRKDERIDLTTTNPVIPFVLPHQEFPPKVPFSKFSLSSVAL